MTLLHVSYMWATRDFVPATVPRYMPPLHVSYMWTTRDFVAAACRCDMCPYVMTPRVRELSILHLTILQFSEM